MHPTKLLILAGLTLSLFLSPHLHAERVATGKQISSKKKTSSGKKKGVSAPRKVGKNTKGKSVESAPVYRTFMKAAKDQCKCTPLGVGTWGSRGNKSCHPVGQAIDVRSANCGGKVSHAVSPGFTKFVMCMKSKGWFKMYNGECVKGVKKNKTTCHYDHAHFSKCCKTKSGSRAC